ncbi:pyridoxal phosphate-dependent aminotransferase [Frigidibacter sp.]|uniref:pyridoxal phosphate-dependent aminotransferase n=1 Tax=Frigidibacter sp. TaxID=2586418 RepID=UPI002735B860|nr:pyridoxal phosphate-dependent aminotransferase [Frigidibacter sp.]MDP3339914.1 pyridoxal phosphate-dependent aminotransferase [Frigidibacter sp.]
MQLAPRIAHIAGTDGDGWGIYYRTREMIRAGERVLNLTIGEHDVKTDAAILTAMHGAAMAGHTGYTFGAGLPELRAAIAKRVQARTGVATRAENVVVTPGGQSALFSTHMALLDRGDTGLYCAPFYPTYPGTIRATGAEAVAVPTRSSRAFQPEAAAIMAAATPTARTLLINSPNNPTGVIYSRETLEGIAEAAQAADLWLISDEVYDTQVWEGQHLSPRALPGMAERTVVIGSMSKSHAMTGSRLGWVVAPEAVVEAITLLSTVTTYGVPAFIQHAALHALAQGEGFEAGIADPFRRRREIAARALAGSQAIRAIPSAGAMYVMLDIRATGLSGNAFAERLLEEERIAVMPGESFGAPAAGHCRVAMTIPDDDFAEAMARLAAFADRLLP